MIRGGERGQPWWAVNSDEEQQTMTSLKEMREQKKKGGIAALSINTVEITVAVP